MSKDLFNENATLNLNFSDVFNTQIFKWKTITKNTATTGEYQRRKPVYKLTFTYRFRQEKERQRVFQGYENSNGLEL